MKQASKNEIDLLAVINKLQDQLSALDKKVDILVQRSESSTKLPPKSIVNTNPMPAKPHDHAKGRERYEAICADCKKECTIPFKPSGDRPVYCKDCFSRRKMISMSGMKLEEKPKEIVPLQPVVNKTVDMPKSPAKTKKKVVAAKKPAAKKKPAPKKTKKR